MIGFIIYPTYKIEDGKSFVYLYGRLKSGKSFEVRYRYDPYFFVRKDDLVKVRELTSFGFEHTNLKTFDEEEVVKIIVDVPDQVAKSRKLLDENGVECFEADIPFSYRFLIDMKIKGSVEINGKSTKGDRVDLFFDQPTLKPSTEKFTIDDLRVLSLDIETSMDSKKVYCISLQSSDDKLSKVLIVANEDYKNSESFKSEAEMFKRFKEIVLEFDPDVLVGWNVIDFDLNILFKKMKHFDFGRAKDDCTVNVVNSFLTDSKADFKGRLVLDGIHMLKSNFISLDDYKLDTAAKEFTDFKKLIGPENKGVEIENAYRNDKQKLVDYNLLDSKLVIDILRNSGTFDLTILRSLLTGMSLERVRASIASMDSLYLAELRSKGYVAVTKSYVNSDKKTTGGFVMSPNPGIYDFVGVFDFKSLYPSIMRTFNIDPLLLRKDCKPKANEELITAPNGACFSKEKGILPEILEKLGKERQIATKNDDQVTRWAIKILMNSLYGVLASPNCRFYSYEMANAITSFGHLVLKELKTEIEKKGLKVIYGDTDSSFVELNVKDKDSAEKIGKSLEDDMNSHFKRMVKEKYGMDSFLELQYEKLFRKFFLPKVRGSEKGAKKRYAGILIKGKDEKIEFTGLEFVRKDWTSLAKKFQLDLLDLVFKEKDPESYVKKFVSGLQNGEFDELLIYRKTIRKDLEKYTKTTPPHVKAARKLDKIDSNIIKYVMTHDGPEPVENIQSSIDYNHYIEKQIKPIADSILYFYGKSFEDVLKGSTQTDLSSF